LHRHTMAGAGKGQKLIRVLLAKFRISGEAI
jgi:hypothetical protein